MITRQDAVDFLKGLEKSSVQMAFLDLPYGVTDCNWDTRIPLEAMRTQLQRVLTQDGVIVCTANMGFAYSLMQAFYGWFRWDYCWDKGRVTGHLNAQSAPLRQHEMILVFAPHRPPKYIPQKWDSGIKKASPGGSRAQVYGEYAKMPYQSGGERYPTSIIRFSMPSNERGIHPTQKPLGLVKWLISTFTDENDLVIDPTAGSGTTAIAALELNRQWCVNDNGWSDKHQKYWQEVIKERVEIWRNRPQQLGFVL